jgi:hypothetical protein
MNSQPHQHQPRLKLWIGLAAVLVAIQAILTLTEANGDPSQSNSWRRTRFGWEHADSLPIKAATPIDFNDKVRVEENRTPLTKNLYRLHSILLPMGVAGFLCCFSTWCLTQYSEKEDFE